MSCRFISAIKFNAQRAFVGTFHGFCQSVLENHGHLIGYAEMPHIFEDEGDRSCTGFNIQSTIEHINNRLLRL
jgi:superfamily I DNA/RNA helicase